MQKELRNEGVGNQEVAEIAVQPTNSKFFIMSTEFDKNISDWRYDCTDHKNDIDFFMRLVK